MNDDVCQLRLDFVTLQLAAPNEQSQCETDTFTFTGSAGANPTVICGQNDGQHSRIFFFQMHYCDLIAI